MVAHDEDFERLFNKETFHKGMNTISTTDSDKLPQFKDQLPLDYGNGQSYQRKDSDCLTYSKLEDIFQELPKEQMLHIDIKGENSDLTVRKVVELVNLYNRQSTTILGSFCHQNVALVRTLDSNIPTFCAPKEARYIIICFLLGLLPYVEVESDSHCYPFITREAIRTNTEQLQGIQSMKDMLLGYLDIGFLILANKVLLNPIFSHLNKRGCLTSYWIINDDDEMEFVMKNTSANGIMTDRPKHLQKKLLNYRQELSQNTTLLA